MAHLIRLLVQRHQHLTADPFRNCNFVVACHMFANPNSFLLFGRNAAFSRAYSPHVMSLIFFLSTIASYSDDVFPLVSMFTAASLKTFYEVIRWSSPRQNGVLIETVKICFAFVWRETRDNWFATGIHRWRLATGLRPLRNSDLDNGIRFIIVDVLRLLIRTRFFGYVRVRFFGLVDFIRYIRLLYSVVFNMC